MIVAYHRPATLQEALDLLSRSEPVTVPLGGGTVLSRPSAGKFAVVDLQLLGLDRIERVGSRLIIGAAVTLQNLYAHADIPDGLREAIARETTFNLRQTASVAGALVTADGKSTFAAAMLALGAMIEWADGTMSPLEQVYKARKDRNTPLILRVAIPADAVMRFEAVSKTPADVPILIGAVGWGENDQARYVLGGAGEAATLVVGRKDPSAEDWIGKTVEQYISNAYSQNSNLVSQNIDYIKETSAVLLRRLSNR